MKQPKDITIGKRTITQSDLFFVVEEGQYNQGDLRKALRMVELAAGTGADAIEFQLSIAEEFYCSSHPGYEIYKPREFSERQLEELASCCRENGINLVVAPFSPRIVRWMAGFGCSAFNVNASDLNNPEILKTVVETGLPFFMSLPLATMQEIEWASSFVEGCGSRPPEYVLLHGQHSMASGEEGVAPVDTSIGFLQTIKQRHNGLVGFIDHTPLPWFPACAAAAGANVITKHMAPNHVERGPDWRICLDPVEMKEAVRLAREVRASLSQHEKVLAPGEYLDRSEMRRSIVFAEDLPAGHKLLAGNLAFKRPGDGIPPDQFSQFVGRELAVAVQKDGKLQASNLK
jgi:sialic acid synthase SpsE